MINIDARTIKEVEKTLGSFSYKAPTVLCRALNRAASTTRTAITKKTRKEYHIKSRDIKNTIKLIKAYKTRLGALVISRGEHIPLDKFRYKPRNPRPSNPPDALNIAVKRDGYKQLKHAFVADIQGNKIFEREGKSRLPIRRLMGPAVPQMIDNEETRDYAEEQAEKIFHKRLEHEIRRILER